MDRKKLIALTIGCTLTLALLPGCSGGNKDKEATKAASAKQVFPTKTTLNNITITVNKLSGYSFTSKSPFGCVGVSVFGKNIAVGENLRSIKILKFEGDQLDYDRDSYGGGSISPRFDPHIIKYSFPVYDSEGHLFFRSNSHLMTFKNNKPSPVFNRMDRLVTSPRGNYGYCYFSTTPVRKAEIEDFSVHTDKKNILFRPKVDNVLREVKYMYIDKDDVVYALGQGEKMVNFIVSYKDGKQTATLGNADRNAPDFIHSCHSITAIGKYILVADSSIQRGLSVYDKKGKYLGTFLHEDLLGAFVTVDRVVALDESNALIVGRKAKNGSGRYEFFFYTAKF